jgi:phosphoadenosine phosphosulfate reductase
MGYRRVGCIGCPMSTKGKEELEKNPKYKAAYFRAAERHIEYRRETCLPMDRKFSSPESLFEWWLKG